MPGITFSWTDRREIPWDHQPSHQNSSGLQRRPSASLIACLRR